MPAPKTEILLSQTVTPVTMDVGTLDRIEEATGKSTAELIDYLRSLSTREVTKEKPLTVEEATAVAKRFKVGLAAKFVAAAADVPAKDVTLEDVMPAFRILAGPFVAAWNQLNGRAAPDPKATGSGTAAPGPESTSESSERNGNG